MLDAVQKEIGGDQRLIFLYGLTCARIGAYARAEAAFNTVLAQHPDDFDVLFNLGRAAARGGHYDRAQRALEVALKLRPGERGFDGWNSGRFTPLFRTMPRPFFFWPRRGNWRRNALT